MPKGKPTSRKDTRETLMLPPPKPWSISQLVNTIKTPEGAKQICDLVKRALQNDPAAKEILKKTFVLKTSDLAQLGLGWNDAHELKWTTCTNPRTYSCFRTVALFFTFLNSPDRAAKNRRRPVAKTSSKKRASRR